MIAITLRSGKDLIDRLSKKNQEVQTELVPQQAEKKQVKTRESKKLGKFKYPKSKATTSDITTTILTEA